jgi:hypothetical protein
MSHHTGTGFRILPAQTVEFAIKSQDIRARTATLGARQWHDKAWGRITSRAEMKEKIGSSGWCIMATTRTNDPGPCNLAISAHTGLKLQLEFCSESQTSAASNDLWNWREAHPHISNSGLPLSRTPPVPIQVHASYPRWWIHSESIRIQGATSNTYNWACVHCCRNGTGPIGPGRNSIVKLRSTRHSSSVQSILAFVLPS